MKTSLLILILSSLIVLSCDKVNKYESTGTITGADMAMCAFCGGYFIEMSRTTYRFEKTELPDYFIFADEQLPLKVELDWSLKTEICTGLNWIKISKIKITQ